MATITPTLTLTSSDLLTDALSLSTTTTITASHTTGLARAVVKSTAKGTASGQITLYTADDYAAIAYLFVKNISATAANKIYIYDDTSSGDPILIQLAGGDFTFIPMHGDKTLKAYNPNGTDPIVEWMVIGTDQ
jgi:formaldehyde-activating enzyme involved in methanogenesis